MIVTLLIIWSAVLTVWCWVMNRTILALNEENENINFCIKNLVKAWLIYRHDEPDGFTADEWYRENFKGEEE